MTAAIWGTTWLLHVRRVAIGRTPRRQDLVDPPSVQVDDLEAPAVEFEAVADLRHAAEMLQHQASDGVIAAMLRYLDRQQVGELVELHPARDQKRVVGAAHIG